MFGWIILKYSALTHSRTLTNLGRGHGIVAFFDQARNRRGKQLLFGDATAFLLGLSDLGGHTVSVV